MSYSFEQFEKEIMTTRPRPFDTYILPLFMAGYAIKSNCMKVSARRILCIAGIYTGYRNYSEYKKILARVRQNLGINIAQRNAIPEGGNNG